MRYSLTTVILEGIQPKLMLTWDQVGIKTVPSSIWIIEQHGCNNVDMIGTNDQYHITAVFCGSLVGDFLLVQLLHKGKTTHYHPKFNYPPGCDITYAAKLWSNEDTMTHYIQNIILSYIEAGRETLDNQDTAGLMVTDYFKCQGTNKVSNLLEKNMSLSACLLPANTTDLL